METTYEISVASLTRVVSFCAGPMGRLVGKDCEGSGSPPCRLGGAKLPKFEVNLLFPQESLHWVLCPLTLGEKGTLEESYMGLLWPRESFNWVPIPLTQGIKVTREEDMGSSSLRMGTGDDASDDVLQRPSSLVVRTLDTGLDTDSESLPELFRMEGEYRTEGDPLVWVRYDRSES
jgi:hypothetical protein